MDTDSARAWQAEWASDDDLDDVLDLLEIATAKGPASVGAGISGTVDGVFWSLVTGDDGRVAAAWRDPLAAALARGRRRDDRRSTLDGLGLIGAATLLCATGDGDDPGPLLAEWLPAACGAGDELDDGGRTSYLLACVAHGFYDRVGHLMADMTADAFEAGPFLGGPLPDVAVQLAEAAVAGKGYADVEPLWLALVAGFAARAEGQWATWVDLLHAGFAVYTRFGGLRPDQVVAAIRADLAAHAPASGPAVLAPSDAQVREALEQVDEIAESGEGLVSVGLALYVAAQGLIPSFLFGDRALAEGAVPALVTGMARARKQRPNPRDHRATSDAASADVLAATLVAALGGAIDPAARLADNLPVLLEAAGDGRLGPDERLELALACAALGKVEPVRSLTLSEPIRFVPGKTFGTRRPDLVGYLAAAQVAGADRASLEPAWRSFVNALPAGLERGHAHWVDALYVWYAVHLGPGRR